MQVAAVFKTTLTLQDGDETLSVGYQFGNYMQFVCDDMRINSYKRKYVKNILQASSVHRHRLTEMDYDMLTINHRNYLHSVAEYEKFFLVQSPGNHPFSLVTGILLSYFYFTVTE